MPDSRPSTWRAGAALLRPHRRRLLVLGLVLTVSSAVALAGPLLLRSFVDRALEGADDASLLVVAGAYVTVALVSPAAELAVYAASTSLIWRIVNDFRVTLTRHVFTLDRSFHTRRSPGTLVERIDGDLTALADFAATFVLTLIRVALTAVGAVLVVAVLDVRIAAALVAYLAIAAAGLAIIRNLAIDESETERGAFGRLYGHLEEFLGGLDDLRANGGGRWAMGRHLVDSHHAFGAAHERERAVVNVWHSATAVVTGGTFVALLVGAFATRSEWITIGTAFLLFQYTQILAQPVYALVEQLQEIQKASGGFRRALDLLGRPSAARHGGVDRLPAGAPTIVLDRVGFAYDDDAVLHDVSLTIPAGRRLGVVGRTGSGKSTLSRLVAGDLLPTSGTIRWADIDVARLDPTALGRRVGVVTQEVYVFGASVRDNVRLFDRSISDDRVLDALARVGLGDRLLDGGLDRLLDGTGSELSAGEAQLLGLARVLVRDPAVVILDEATARVDPGTEDRLRQAMALLLEGRTAIVIAHRLSTLDLVDDVLVLDRGRIVEHGSRADLLADDTAFARLHALSANAEGAG